MTILPSERGPFENMLVVERFALGPHATNAYLLYSAESGECVVVDPAAEAHVLLQRIHELDDN